MQTLFVAPAGQQVGLTTVALGLVRALQRQGRTVSFLKPITHSEQPERSAQFSKLLLGRDLPHSIARSEAEALLGDDQEDELMERVVGLAQQAAQGAEVLVVEGITLGPHNPYGVPLNASVARNLMADTVLVATLDGRSAADVADTLEIAAREYGRGGRVVGYVLNYAPRDTDYGALMAEIRRRSRTLAALPLLGLIAREPGLNAPRTLDIARELGAQVLNEGELASRRVEHTLVSARSARHLAGLLQTGTLVVTPGDREDVVMAASLAHLSGVPLAGLLLTAGSLPEAPIRELCRSALSAEMPVLLVGTNTYTTAQHLAGLSPKLPLDDVDRIERTLEHVADRLDVLPLGEAGPETGGLRRMSPPAFRYTLIQKAAAAGKRIVLPEGDEPRTVRAAVICHEKGIARCVLLATRDAVETVARAQGLTLPPELEIVDPDTVRGRYVAGLVERRAHRGMTEPMAAQQLEDTVVLGTMMLAQGEVDGLVSGAVNTTANTVRPALQLIKTAPGAGLVSSIFFMLMPDQVLVYGDAAINPNPNAEELAQIAVQSADSALAFGIEPRVAMLSYSTGASGSGTDVEKVKEATRLVRERRPDIVVDGPLQYDAASVPSVGAQKAPGSPVAGRATVFIFPDLNTGNTTYKAVQRSAGVVAVGPMLQGLNKPVNDLSRGALVDDIVYTIAITAIQAAQGAGGGDA